jgi:hypothetical protein
MDIRACIHADGHKQIYRYSRKQTYDTYFNQKKKKKKIVNKKLKKK